MYDAIIHDLKAYKLGWHIDDEIDYDDHAGIENALNKVGAYRDKVVLWGDGSVYRELMCSDDLADACVYLMENKDYKDIGEYVNITRENDIQLKELFIIIQNVVGFEGKIEYDTSKPNGTPRKVLDATKIKALGWEPKIPLVEGISSFYQWYCSNTMSA